MSPRLADILIVGAVGALSDALANNLAHRGLHVLQQAGESAADAASSTRLGASVADPGGGGRIEPVVVDPGDATSIDQLLSRCARLVLLPGLGACAAGGSDPGSLLAGQSELVRRLIQGAMRQGRPLLLVDSVEDTDGVADAALHRQAWRLVSAQAALLARSGTDPDWVFAQARLFGVYGPDCHRWGLPGLTGRLLGDLLAGEPLVLADGGAAVRGFCALDDAAEALARLALGLTAEATYRGRCIDVGYPWPITVAEFAGELTQLCGQPAATRPATDAELGTEPPVSPLLPDTVALEQAVGYLPATELRTGLQRTLGELGRLAETPAAGAGGERPAMVGNIRPYFEVDRALTASIGHILISGQATNSGRHQRELEARLADWLGVDELAVVSNGADALLAALAAAEPDPPDCKVILPSYTFVATLNAVLGHGLTPVFCDIDPGTFTLCPRALERLLETTEGVAWVVPVNVFGVPADIAAITRLAKAAGARVLYDNCHGFGSEQDGLRVLDGPAAQTVSMHATKVLPGVEGGMVLSPDRELLGRVRQQRNHGIAPDPLRSIPGVNTKLDEVRAAIALAQLDHIDGAIARRRDYAERLRGFIDRAGLAGCYRLQRIPAGVRSNFQNHGVLCPVALDVGRDAVIDALAGHGVGARPYFHPALHRLERYRGRDFDLPITDRVWSSWICLPLHARMSERDLKTIENALLAVAERFAANQHTQIPLPEPTERTPTP